MLNYRQLHQFWHVARAGSVRRAAEQLHLTPQTLSGQIGEFESRWGVQLFERQGRQLVLTEMGRQLLERADGLFHQGQAIEQWLRQGPVAERRRFRVGVLESVPRLMVARLVAPLASLPDWRVECLSGSAEAMFSSLGTHRLDAVVADRPLPAHLGLRATSHRLGECGASFFEGRAGLRGRAVSFDGPGQAQGSGLAERELAEHLSGRPLLLPGEGFASRAPVEAWLRAHVRELDVAGVFDDSALMKQLGAEGLGVFPAPDAVRAEVESLPGVKRLGAIPGVRLRYFLLTLERQLRHPLTKLLLEGAKARLATDGLS